ncbi:disease resistance-like protein CSA1 [Neltuma alba]|uniref:disease resistance-like protein CSA1 n=1 Tax=Neltuma alba TaxID=207710 RepID=UPI0010A37C02|nr:disease resistance-like protein CSA1 [Prosopis alba]
MSELFAFGGWAVWTKQLFQEHYITSGVVEKVGEKSKNHGIQPVKKDLILALLGDNYDPVNNLVGRRDWFKLGSKILITTRDKQVLGTNVDRDAIYERKGLDSNEAFKLFSSHALGKDRPAPHPKLGRLAKKVTHRAKGNPLALRHLGNSAVSGKEDPEAWESLLENLQHHLIHTLTVP